MRKKTEKNPRRKPWIYANPARLDCTGHIAGAETPCTDVYMARSTIDNCLNTLHIGLPHPIGTPMRVRDLDAERNALIAELALSHPLHLLAVIKSRLGHSQAVDTITDCITKCKYYFQKIGSPAIFSPKRHSAADSGPRREAKPRPKIEQPPGDGPSVDHSGIGIVPDPD